ncbi:763_t:CDS:1, partial [Rhizophagus irregularis]
RKQSGRDRSLAAGTNYKELVKNKTIPISVEGDKELKAKKKIKNPDLSP